MSAPGRFPREVRTAINQRAYVFGQEVEKRAKAWLEGKVREKFTAPHSFDLGAMLAELDSHAVEDWIAAESPAAAEPSDDVELDDDALNDAEPF